MPRPKRGLSDADANTRVKTARTKSGKTDTKTIATEKTATEETQSERRVATATGKRTATTRKTTAEMKTAAKGSGAATGTMAPTEESSTDKAGAGNKVKTRTRATGVKEAMTDKTSTKKADAGKIAANKNPDTAGSTAKKDTAKKPQNAKSAPPKPSRAENSPFANVEWVTYCAPWDRRDSDSDSSVEEDDPEDSDAGPHGSNCKCMKPLSENPDWPWIISKDGVRLANKWQLEQNKRCQDAFGVYFYNDYNGYGIGEVVDAILVSLDKELSKKRISPAKLWAQLEGMSLFLNTDIVEWFGCDDADGVSSRIRIIGSGLLAALNVLFSTPGSTTTPATVKNLPLTLALFLVFANDWCDMLGGPEPCTAWNRGVVALAERWGVEIKGPKGVEEIVEKIKDQGEIEDEEEDNEENHDPATETVASWAAEFSALKAEHGPARGKEKFGGSYYDITKIPERELQALRHGDVDDDLW